MSRILVVTQASGCCKTLSKLESRTSALALRCIRTLGSASQSTVYRPGRLFSVLNKSHEAAGLIDEHEDQRLTVHCYWDLDNKTVESSEEISGLVDSIKTTLAAYGKLSTLKAFGNKSCFDWLPAGEREARDARERARKEPSEQKCGICGAKFKTLEKFEKHFRQLHEREMKKRQNNRRHHKSFFQDKGKLERYYDTKNMVVDPKAGFNLRMRLIKEGVEVVKVENKPQAADEALKREAGALLNTIRREMNSNSHLLCIISDDNGFRETFEKFRDEGYQTLALCNDPLGLGQAADLQLSWPLLRLGVLREPLSD